MSQKLNLGVTILDPNIGKRRTYIVRMPYEAYTWLVEHAGTQPGLSKTELAIRVREVCEAILNGKKSIDQIADENGVTLSAVIRKLLLTRFGVSLSSHWPPPLLTPARVANVRSRTKVVRKTKDDADVSRLLSKVHKLDSTPYYIQHAIEQLFEQRGWGTP